MRASPICPSPPPRWPPGSAPSRSRRCSARRGCRMRTPGRPSGMPRSIFNATISFGLVNVPIKLYSATESKTVHFREIHEPDGAPLDHRRIDPDTGEEVDAEHIVKGYEISEGEFVVLTKDEVAAAA